MEGDKSKTKQSPQTNKRTKMKKPKKKLTLEERVEGLETNLSIVISRIWKLELELEALKELKKTTN